MESQNARTLMQKYWSGDTSPAEEAVLQRMAWEGSPELQEEEIEFLRNLQQYAEVDLPQEFDDELLSKLELRSRSSWIRPWLRVAAVAVILISAGFLVWHAGGQKQKKLAQQEEARRAFELTKQALYLVSSELNRGASFAQELEVFDEIVEKIKAEPADLN